MGVPEKYQRWLRLEGSFEAVFFLSGVMAVVWCGVIIAMHACMHSRLFFVYMGLSMHRFCYSSSSAFPSFLAFRSVLVLLRWDTIKKEKFASCEMDEHEDTE